MVDGEGGAPGPIRDVAHLRRLMEEDYALEGPREDASKNLAVFERFLGRGHEFVPEGWLESMGYEFVEPSTFTKGYRLAYKTEGGVTVQYFRSNYSLCRKDRRISLYLRGT